MAKLTAVIDIGSNSARLVIYQKTSRFGFHLLSQHKSRVRIGEGAYHKKGHLQPEPMERAYQTLGSFSNIIHEYKVKKVLCVATSALRDAPNGSEFVQRVQRGLGLSIKIIDGETEARYGAIAAANLLPLKRGITIDIGGGSSDMARIEGGKIVETFSLNLGTVRLKELFATKQIDIPKAKKFIEEEIARLPETFKSDMAVGIGGTARAIARGIMVAESYPLDKIHAFEYKIKEQKRYMDKIVKADIDQLEALHIKEARYDTIREGALIWRSILEYIGAKRVYTSGVGVREGVYLHERLRKYGDRFPPDINTSIQSIKDRFDLIDLPSGHQKKIARRLFKLLEERFKYTKHDVQMVMYALDLSNIGKMLTIYKEHQHAFYIAMQELNYGFTHQEMMLAAMILRSKGKKYHKTLYKEYKELMPPKKKLQWLIFIYSLTLILHENSAGLEVKFTCKNGILTVNRDTLPYLAISEIEELPLPDSIKLRIQ